MDVLTAALIQPIVARVRRLGTLLPLSGPRAGGGGHGPSSTPHSANHGMRRATAVPRRCSTTAFGASPKIDANVTAGVTHEVGTEQELSRTYGHVFACLHRWLAAAAMHRLLQRLWTETLAELTRALQQRLFSPRLIGTDFVLGATELLAALGAILREDSNGPSRTWLTQRATPLQSTLKLTDLPTPALLQQYRIQPVGPRRAAPLVALALRMDDGEAASLIAESQPPELADADSTLLAVDGLAALEAYGRKVDAL